MGIPLTKPLVVPEYETARVKLYVAHPVYVFGNRVAGSELDRVYQGKREPNHRTSE